MNLATGERRKLPAAPAELASGADFGGSYGGYVVMVAVTDYPDLFAAGANLFGIVNFETFFSQSTPWMGAISTGEYGDPKTQRQLLRDLSPIQTSRSITSCPRTKGMAGGSR